jgi:four helix bundle protein
MNPWGEELKARTMRFALDVVGFCRALPRDFVGDEVRRQLLRSAFGVAFNYRSACRARSHAEFVAKIGVVLEEADESEGWLSVCEEAQLSNSSELVHLRNESRELRSIFMKANQTARQRPR